MRGWRPGGGVISLAAALMAGIAAQPAVSQELPPPFRTLEGTWQGEGALFGQAARFDLRWERLNNFMTLDFASHLVDSLGQRSPVIRAAALYRVHASNPRATWEDSRGVQIAIMWSATDSVLVADWSGATETGRTSYALHADGTLEVSDEMTREGRLIPFGHAIYRRVVP